MYYCVSCGIFLADEMFDNDKKSSFYKSYQYDPILWDPKHPFHENKTQLHSMREERGLSRTFMRFLYNPCEPKHLAWQWQVKNSPAIARCSDSCLRRKECPPKRFFPRLKKRYIYKDLTSCKEKDVPGVKKKSTSWKEFFTYLLPPEIQKKPKLSCCRKLMEMRRQQCSSIDDWKSCDASCCWPAPLEWMGQGVLHEFPATLPPSATLPVPQPCPPPQHMVPRCVIAKMVACPVPKTKPLCLEEYAYEAPFANFQGAAPTPQPQYTIKCPLPCTDVPLVSEKSLRLSCKTYGEFKGVECPKSMFTRFLSVNVAPDGRLLPSPVSRHSPQSEMSKPSCKSFHTSTCLLSSNEDPPRNAIDNLQPNRSPINMDRLAERAGFQLGRDSQEKKKNLKMPKSPIFASRLSEEERAEEELEEVERELEMSPEEKEARQREFERLSKSPLQLLTQKQLARKGSSAASLPAIEQPLFGDKPVDLEDPPYTSQSRRSFHTSSSDWAAKKKKDSSNKQKKPKVAKEQPICGGCPAIKLAENPDPTYVEGSFKKKCRRRAAGTCKGKKIHVDPKDPPPPNPYQKCREKIYSPCLMPREKIVKEEYKKPIDCKDKSYRKFHTSAAVGYKKAGTPTGSSQPLATKPTLKSYSCVETGEEYKTADSQGGGDKERTLSKHTAGLEAGEHKKGIIARIKELMKRKTN